ncbi:MAG: ATP-binding protein [Vicinamibacterales bacterium]
MTPQASLLLFAGAEVSLAVLFGGLYFRLSRVYQRRDLLWWTQAWGWLLAHSAAIVLDDAVHAAGAAWQPARLVSVAAFIGTSTLGLRSLWFGVRAFTDLEEHPRLERLTLAGTVALALGVGALVASGVVPDAWSMAFPEVVRATLASGLAALCTAVAWRRRSWYPGAVLTTAGMAALTVAQAHYAWIALRGGLSGAQYGSPLSNFFDWLIWTVLGVGAITWLVHHEREAAERAAAAAEALRRDLAARERRLDAIVNGITERILILDATGRIVYSGRPTTTTEFFTSAELEGQPMESFVHPDDHPILHGAFARISAGPDAVGDGTIRVRTKAGGWLAYECQGRNLLHDPSVRGILITARDVTERLRLERQLRDAHRMESIGRLAGGIAHDFNNLLTVITGNAELGREFLTPGSPGYDEITQIEAAADRATTLTRQLLAFARRQVVKPAIVDPGAVLVEMEALVRRLAGGHIAVALRIDPTHPLVRADRGQIEQVVLNLVANGRDAMSDGGHLTIATGTRVVGSTPPVDGLAPGEYVTLSVADTGAGLTPEAMVHAFEPFFTTKDVGEGTGLGLASCYGIAAQHGGLVGVESTPGRGATFTLYLPRITEVAPTSDRATTLPRTVGQEHVLIVEDDADVRRVAVRALRSRGFEVLEAPDGEVAWELLRATPGIDCVVTDVAMPVLGGGPFVRRVRAAAMRVPVVFTSGYTNEDALTSLLDDLTVFVPKPYSAEALAARVRSLIDTVRAASGQR